MSPRTKGSVSNVLTLTADGQECARLDLDREVRVRFDIGPYIEMIEVWAEDEDGRFPLASLVVPFDATTGQQQSIEATSRLPGAGQELSFRVVVPQASDSSTRSAAAATGDGFEELVPESEVSPGAEVVVSLGSNG